MGNSTKGYLPDGRLYRDRGVAIVALGDLMTEGLRRLADDFGHRLHSCSDPHEVRSGMELAAELTGCSMEWSKFENDYFVIVMDRSEANAEQRLRQAVASLQTCYGRMPGHMKRRLSKVG